MVKLKPEAERRHRQAEQLVRLRRDLNLEERYFVAEHWLEVATLDNSSNGAFFTPMDLAADMELMVSGDRVLDLCAGTGRLSLGCRDEHFRSSLGWPAREFVCVERNEEYVRVGRKVMPEAEWVVADVFSLAKLDLGQFDTVISNPPYGKTARVGRPGDLNLAYRGYRFEYHVLDVAADYAPRGAFLIPQASAPFRCSGVSGGEWNGGDEEYRRLEAETGIVLRRSVQIDTSGYAKQWSTRVPQVEVVEALFPDWRRVPKRPVAAPPVKAAPAIEAQQLDLFGGAR
ncbi:methyltransferase [Kitasatospora sp. NPDC056076]|uniref:methyltransferase n=1 Tax=Kitasatospora sp. NPDC056076 TaxID=3345703 RepID=UPI0035DDE8EF